ncbi:MAG TPA: tyrosine-type recombinase/integrase [Mycobacterium sp.]|jgi:integrase|uniref:tyrosine-type recombinase/integrase n=1 Tax=Mycobacterium sp. TaxID=1785 RepID=UPI002F3F6393
MPLIVHLPKNWSDAIQAWTSYLRAASRPQTTENLRTYHLRRFAGDHRELAPWDVTLDDLVQWLASFDWAVETKRSYRASLRTFYHWAHITGQIPANPAAQLPAITPPIGKPRPAAEAVFREALAAALRRNDKRLWLMLMLAGTQGLRRGEICCVHTVDLELDLEGWSLRVHGKGRRIRMVPLNELLSRELRKLPIGYVFPGQIEGHLSPSYVGKLISRGLPEGITAHPLRHRFAGRVYAQDRDIRAVQELLGHASVRTTQIYTPVPAGALRGAITAAA